MSDDRSKKPNRPDATVAFPEMPEMPAIPPAARPHATIMQVPMGNAPAKDAAEEQAPATEPHPDAEEEGPASTETMVMDRDQVFLAQLKERMGNQTGGATLAVDLAAPPGEALPFPAKSSSPPAQPVPSAHLPFRRLEDTLDDEGNIETLDDEGKIETLDDGDEESDVTSTVEVPPDTELARQLDRQALPFQGKRDAPAPAAHGPALGKGATLDPRQIRAAMAAMPFDRKHAAAAPPEPTPPRAASTPAPPPPVRAQPPAAASTPPAAPATPTIEPAQPKRLSSSFRTMGQVMLVPPQQEEALPFVAAPSEPPMAAAPAGELPQALPYEAAHRSLGASFMAAMMRSGWTPKS